MAEAGVLSPVDSTEYVFIAFRSQRCHISMAEAGVLSPVDSTEYVFIAFRSQRCHISMAEAGVHSPSSILASLYVVDGVLSRSLSFLRVASFVRWV
jgi:hypothetical protein